MSETEVKQYDSSDLELRRQAKRDILELVSGDDWHLVLKGNTELSDDYDNIHEGAYIILVKSDDIKEYDRLLQLPEDDKNRTVIKAMKVMFGQLTHMMVRKAVTTLVENGYTPLYSGLPFAIGRNDD